MKSLRERTEIQQAYLDGVEIEYKSNKYESTYSDVGLNCAFCHWVGGDYRIKPKPMEIWVNVFPDGSEKYFIHESKEEAIQCVAKRARTVKFIEVIE